MRDSSYIEVDISRSSSLKNPDYFIRYTPYYNFTGRGKTQRYIKIQVNSND